MALPSNRIPRVYANTGIELNMIKDFVYEIATRDKRFVIVKPITPIIPMLQSHGYPFKSKMHSDNVKKYQKGGLSYKVVRAYTGRENTIAGKPIFNPCPKKLLYQFTPENTLKISDDCCMELKEKPLTNWQIANNKPYSIVGIMREEGGRRSRSVCMVFKGQHFKKFQPLVAITKEWEEWFIDKYNIKICDIYKPPYNFRRTGCKGCPFAVDLQNELNVLQEYFPEERKQCEIIWQPVYSEYRRLNYRLKGSESNE